MPLIGALPADLVYLGSQTIGNLARGLVYTVLAVYYVTVVGLDPLQLVLVGTILEGTILLLEVPTGVLADVFNRKHTIVAGRMLVGLAFIAQALVPRFELILIAEALRAVGESCLSGATQAWLADEVGETRVGGLFMRAAQLRIAGYLIGIGCSVTLASTQLQLPILVGGGLTIGTAGLLAVGMPERRQFYGAGTGARMAIRPSGWRTFTEAIALIRSRPVLGVLLGVSLSIGAASEGLDRLWEAHLLRTFVFPSLGQLQPIVWFGIIQAGGLLLGIGAVQAIRGVDTTNHRALARSLRLVQIVQVASTAVFAFATNFPLAVLALWSSRAVSQASQPLYDTWLTRSAPSHVRATIISAASQANALGQVLGGPVVGTIGRLVSLSVALLAAGLLLLPSVGLLTRSHTLADPD